MESLVALSPGAGAADVAVGTAYEDCQIGALTVMGGGAFENAGLTGNNGVRYIGVPSGENRFTFTAIVTCSSVADAKRLVFAFFHNGVESVCADAIASTKTTGLTVTVNGCGVLAVNDVISLSYKSDDGAVVTISKARIVLTQIA